MDSWSTALLVIAVIGFLNALVRPMLVFFKLSPTLLTFGLATSLVNGLMMWLAGEFMPGLAVSGVWPVLLVALGMATISVSFSDLLAIDDDDSYYHHVVRHIIDLYGRPKKTDTPGVVFLEIDGLSEPALRRAIRDGHMPMLARWLESGSHKLVRWECDLSSQTSASQAGILLGDNFDIPAFRWYEKDRGRQMVSNNPNDTVAIERRLSTGTGLLARNGASRGNLFSGDAPQTMFTAARAERCQSRQPVLWRCAADHVHCQHPRQLLKTPHPRFLPVIHGRRERPPLGFIVFVGRCLGVASGQVPTAARRATTCSSWGDVPTIARFHDHPLARAESLCLDRRHVCRRSVCIRHLCRIRRSRPSLRGRAPGRSRRLAQARRAIRTA
jgi:uncharacterized membrane protein YvlD (DUF360 family)